MSTHTYTRTHTQTLTHTDRSKNYLRFLQYSHAISPFSRVNLYEIYIFLPMVAVVHCNFALPADMGCNTVAAIAVVADTQLVVLDPMVTAAVVVAQVVVMWVEVVADLGVAAAEVHRNYFLEVEVLERYYFIVLSKTILKSRDLNIPYACLGGDENVVPERHLSGLQNHLWDFEQTLP